MPVAKERTAFVVSRMGNRSLSHDAVISAKTDQWYKPVSRIELDEKRYEELYQHIVKYEGIELKSYDCPSGQLTIGIGHTKTVYPGMVISKRQARRLFDEDISAIEKRIKSFGLKYPMSDYEYMALVAFAFNIGTEALAPRASKVGRLLHQGRYEEMRMAMKEWHRIEDPRTGKKVALPRLKERREEEYRMAQKLPQGIHAVSDVLALNDETQSPTQERVISLSAGQRSL